MRGSSGKTETGTILLGALSKNTSQRVINNVRKRTRTIWHKDDVLMLDDPKKLPLKQLLNMRVSATSK